MSQTIDDISSMQTYESGVKIIVDMTKCRLSHCWQIAILVIIREQNVARRGTKTRPVDILLSDSDMRQFHISDQIDALALHRKILSDRAIENFAWM